MNFKLTRVFITSIIFLNLTACTTHYIKPGGTNTEFQRDQTDCLVKANQAGFAKNDQQNDYFGIQRQSFINTCLEGQGWKKAK